MLFVSARSRDKLAPKPTTKKETETHRPGLIRKKRFIHPVHGSKVGHVVEEDGNFDGVFQ